MQELPSSWEPLGQDSDANNTQNALLLYKILRDYRPLTPHPRLQPMVCP
ncbi:hypothetical protein D082_16950 [Synechocystis sp. PCC 6714]|nr:hypothetical protein D082_16950 [Synechocystis sp. PCC 6714]